MSHFKDSHLRRLWILDTHIPKISRPTGVRCRTQPEPLLQLFVQVIFDILRQLCRPVDLLSEEWSAVIAEEQRPINVRRRICTRRVPDSGIHCDDAT